MGDLCDNSAELNVILRGNLDVNRAKRIRIELVSIGPNISLLHQTFSQRNAI